MPPLTKTWTSRAILWSPSLPHHQTSLAHIGPAIAYLPSGSNLFVGPIIPINISSLQTHFLLGCLTWSKPPELLGLPVNYLQLWARCRAILPHMDEECIIELVYHWSDAGCDWILSVGAGMGSLTWMVSKTALFRKSHCLYTPAETFFSQSPQHSMSSHPRLELLPNRADGM